MDARNALIERALAIALEAHTGQVDKAGQAYILHPLRLMHAMQSDEQRIVAIMHDVIEDTDWTLNRLREEGFGERVVRAIDAVTNRPGEDYDEFVMRAKADPIGRAVKMADVEDNMNTRRLETLKDKDLKRLAKYHRAWRTLANLMK